MLLALCHHCWTWMEPKQDRCIECGQPVNLNEPDPNDVALQELFGAPLLVIAEVTINRPKLPAGGVLSAYAHGLLFLPDVRVLPTGGIVGDSPEGSSTTAERSGFWNLFSLRTRSASESRTPADRPLLTTAAAAERFLDSPGALFVRLETTTRIHQRGRVLRIERKPGRTAAFRIDSPLPFAVENLQRIRQSAGWGNVG